MAERWNKAVWRRRDDVILPQEADTTQRYFKADPELSQATRLALRRTASGHSQSPNPKSWCWIPWPGSREIQVAGDNMLIPDGSQACVGGTSSAAQSRLAVST